MMKFFKGRESTRVKGIGACRAVYESPEVQRVDITFINEDNCKLTLELTPQQARTLIGDVSCSYEAICPPLTKGGAASWIGMHDGN